MRNCATIAPHRSPHDAPLLAAQMRPELTRDGLGLTELEFVLAMLIELGIVEWGKVPQNGQSMGKVPTWRCHQTSAPVPPQGAPGGSGQLGTPSGRPRQWDPYGIPATASDARASRLDR